MVDFDAITIDALRQRRSAKWRTYDPDVLPAWIAESDVPLAEPIRAALHEAVDRGDTGYAHLAALYEATAGWLSDRFGWPVGPADVVGTPDVMRGVAEVVRATTEPGEGVVINPPVYPPFYTAIARTGRRVVEVPLLSSAEGWRLDLAGVQAAFRAGFHAFLLCSPHNPVGAVWPRETLAEVARLADRYGVSVLSDEIHAPLALPGATHTAYPTVSRAAAEHGVVFISASKAWNVAGLKCAVAVAGSPRMRQLLGRVDPHLPWEVGHLGAIAMVAAMRDGGPWLAEFLRHIDRNRRLLAELLAERLPKVHYRPPDASYLAWLDFRDVGLDADAASVLLERGRVAVNSGRDFGAAGDGFVRLNIGTSRDVLTEAIRRISAAVSA